MMSSVRVAVRVRPLNPRELNLRSNVVVSMQNKVVKVTNPKIFEAANANSSITDNGMSSSMTRSSTGSDTFSPSSADVKEFPFHFCFWSCDKSDGHFVGQEVIYQHMGDDVVKAAYDGYNACVFAYGQTGSGKTYSMMGSEEDPGLIPRICKKLFDGMVSDDEITYRTEVSYLEIYNEKVHDLLKTDLRNTPGSGNVSLRVREHPKDGPYVQGLSRHIANGYRDVLDLMSKGNNLRTTASTNMNDTSSRSHAIFTILFTQAKFSKDQPEEKYSKIHLVDLAGSERAHATGATGHRLKEGGSINKSLVLLGNVISTLSEKSTNRKVTFIPYRDSVLTWLLKDSLGGNSKTMMIATISPAACNYSETLSTLRYASRAKNIINRPEVNEDPNVKVIRELRAEIARLRDRLESQGHETTGIGTEGMVERLQASEARVAVLTQAWTGRWSEAMSVLKEKGELALRPLESGTSGVVLDSSLPYLAAIMTDELSTGISLFHLKEGTTMVGSDKETQDIVLGGSGVLSHHCSIDTVRPQEDSDIDTLNESHGSNNDQKFIYTVTLQPIGDASCIVNGAEIEGTVKLVHGSILQFGNFEIFRFNNPAEAKKLREGRRENNVQNQGRALSLLSRSLFELNKMDDHFPAAENVMDDRITGKRRELADMEERLCESETRWRKEAQEKEAELEAKRKRLEELQSNLEESKSRISSEARKNRRLSLDIQRYNNCSSPAELFAQMQGDLEEKYKGIMDSEMDLLNGESKELEEQVERDNTQFKREESELKQALSDKQKECKTAADEVARLQEDLRTLGQMKERGEVSPEEFTEYHSAVATEIQQQTAQLNDTKVSLDRLTVSTDSALRAVAERRRIADQDAVVARHDLEIRQAAMRRDLNRRMNEELASLVEDLVRNSSGRKEKLRYDAIPEDLAAGCIFNSYEGNESTTKGKIGETENEVMALTMQVRAAEESINAEEQILADKEEQVELKRWRLNELEESRRLSLIVEEEMRRRSEERKKEAVEEQKKEESRQHQTNLMQQQHALEIAELRRRMEPHAFPRSTSTSSSEDSSFPHGSVPSYRSFSPLRHTQSLMNLGPRTISEVDEESWPTSIDIFVLRYLLRSNFVEYEIKAVVGMESWIVCRRYSLIREFHDDLRKLYPGVRDIEFPPRTMFWDSHEKVAQSRVTSLEKYFRQLVHYLQRHPYCNLNPRKTRSPLCKNLVCQVLPILRKGEFDNTRFTTA